LLEEIGHGGMGVVWKARQLSLNRLVALKMIRAGGWASAAEIQRFRTEAEAIAQLQHPNIVAIHEVGQHAGQHFFAMDYVTGRTLAELAREGPMPATRAATYLRAIAGAVHYAHRQGILHCDLKPSNVLIDEHDQPRITDFGLAKRFVVADVSPRQSASGPAEKPAPTDLPTGQAGVGGDSQLSTLNSQLSTDPHGPSAGFPPITCRRSKRRGGTARSVRRAMCMRWERCCIIWSLVARPFRPTR
jgi:serine/threonine-protein kinase